MPQRLDRRTFLAILGVGGLSVLLSRDVARAEAKPPLPGALLLANIRTPPFRDAVVLLFEHGPRGSQGLIINKPDHRSLGRIMVGMNIRFRDRATFERYAESEVLYGGPVGRDRALTLVHTPPGRWAPSWSLGKVGITSSTPEMLRDLAGGTAALEQVVACLGVSGWAPEQLQGEIAAGHWQVVYPEPEALPALLFDTPTCDRLDKARILPEGRPISVPREAI
jgi:putative transcriptional regulator